MKKSIEAEDIQGKKTPSCVATLPAAVDTEPPTCGFNADDQNGVMEFHIQDTLSGLSEITILERVNASLSQSAFTPGTRGPVVVTATRVDPFKDTSVKLRVTDVGSQVGGILKPNVDFCAWSVKTIIVGGNANNEKS